MSESKEGLLYIKDLLKNIKSLDKQDKYQGLRLEVWPTGYHVNWFGKQGINDAFKFIREAVEFLISIQSELTPNPVTRTLSMGTQFRVATSGISITVPAEHHGTTIPLTYMDISEIQSAIKEFQDINS